jgi:hypothetical protein
MDRRSCDLEVGVWQEKALLLQDGANLAEDPRGGDVEGENRDRRKHAFLITDCSQAMGVPFGARANCGRRSCSA